MKKLALISVTALLLSCEKDAAQSPELNAPISGTQSEVSAPQALLYLYEEEKLARDVYTYLDSAWNEKQFTNIKASEQRHMEAVAQLLEARGLHYPHLPQGQFQDSTLQLLYHQLIAQGKSSAVAALKVGATIEDLDIVDIEEMKPLFADAPQVLTVLDNLQCGSENHLRAFYRGMGTYQSDYQPQYLTPAQFEAIVQGEMQPCGNGGQGNGGSGGNGGR